MTANGIASGLYHNVIKSTGNSAIYKPSSSILTNPLTDKYAIGENIGRGKFAVVKKCISTETGEEVAAKFIKKRRRGKSCREEILREVVMLEMALEHPRLVNLKEVYETSTELILITEYCAGGELFTECILEEKFNEADVRLLMSQILEGLVYLHDKNIVHLDLKPQNILLTHEFPEGSVKICDLGFACLVNTGEDIRDIIGTPDYVAPEVLNYDPLGLYTDMWSLGVLTYVMLTTCSPFAGDDKQQTFCNITTVKLDFPQDLFEEISDAAQDFIRKLLIAEPSERMTAAECMQHDWITGGQSLARPISTVEERENASLPDITVTSEEASSAVSENDADINRPELHEKVRDETSEMSVTEDIEDSCPTTGSESDMKAIEQTESDMKVDTSVSNSEILSGIETESNKSTNVISDNGKSTDEIKNAKIVPPLITDDIQTPDSESSMCISDSRLDDDDSGVGTGTETRAESETRNVSGRSSTDYLTDKDYDTDVIEELNTDQEHVEESTGDQDMPNKCLLENNLDGTPDGNETVQELNETRNIDNLSVESDINTINSHVTVVVEGQAEMEHSDLINITQTSDLTDIHSSSISEKEDKSDPILGSPTVDSSETRIPDFQPMDQTSPSSIHKLHISFRDVHTSSNLINLPNNSVEKIGTGLDETVQAVPSSGEKLKRVMCNPNTTQGADNSENVDQEEYEFVSVSKRVKSYEESLTVTKNQQTSPKIQRSPRTGRHLKSHHQHH